MNDLRCQQIGLPWPSSCHNQVQALPNLFDVYLKLQSTSFTLFIVTEARGTSYSTLLKFCILIIGLHLWPLGVGHLIFSISIVFGLAINSLFVSIFQCSLLAHRRVSVPLLFHLATTPVNLTHQVLIQDSLIYHSCFLTVACSSAEYLQWQLLINTIFVVRQSLVLSRVIFLCWSDAFLDKSVQSHLSLTDVFLAVLLRHTARFFDCFILHQPFKPFLRVFASLVNRLDHRQVLAHSYVHFSPLCATCPKSSR